MDTISIAIDGPSGAGKSTLARSAAAQLGYLYVDTGAIYRTIACYMLRNGIDPADAETVTASLPQIQVELTYGADGLQHMLLNGEDVTSEIRLPQVSACASVVSAYPQVRSFLLDMQRTLAETHNVIMDGRDIGTVVLPRAKVKIFLTASPEVRAKRRTAELEAKGQTANYEKVLKEIQQRDYQDSHRAIAPLKQAKDAVKVDTSELDIDGVVAAIRKIVEGKIGQ